MGRKIGRTERNSRRRERTWGRAERRRPGVQSARRDGPRRVRQKGGRGRESDEWRGMEPEISVFEAASGETFPLAVKSE